MRKLMTILCLTGWSEAKHTHTHTHTPAEISKIIIAITLTWRWFLLGVGVCVWRVRQWRVKNFPHSISHHYFTHWTVALILNWTVAFQPINMNRDEIFLFFFYFLLTQSSGNCNNKASWDSNGREVGRVRENCECEQITVVITYANWAMRHWTLCTLVESVQLFKTVYSQFSWDAQIPGRHMVSSTVFPMTLLLDIVPCQECVRFIFPGGRGRVSEIRRLAIYPHINIDSTPASTNLKAGEKKKTKRNVNQVAVPLSSVRCYHRRYDWRLMFHWNVIWCSLNKAFDLFVRVSKRAQTYHMWHCLVHTGKETIM